MIVVWPRTYALSVDCCVLLKGGRSQAQSAIAAPATASAAKASVSGQPRLGGAQPRAATGAGVAAGALAVGGGVDSGTSTGSSMRSFDTGAGAPPPVSVGRSFSAIAPGAPHFLHGREFGGQWVDAAHLVIDP